MPRLAIVACGVLILVGGVVLSLDGAAPIPQALQNADRIYAEATKKAAATYDRAVTEAHAAYIAALERAITQETKAGHLDAALAIRERRDAVKQSGPPSVQTLLNNQRPLATDGNGGAAAPPQINWAKLYRNSAKITTVSMEPLPLKESDDKQGWQRVPGALKRHGATVYMSVGRDNGVADFEVVKAGTLLLACSFSYQGNSEGDWQESRWTKEQFVQNGWNEVPTSQLDGILVGGTGQEQIVFLKQVKVGDKFRLRCNKYEPPHVIVFP